MSEQAGRYQRSFSGLIGALLITLVVIGGYVAFRALNRDEVDAGPQTVDYMETVDAVYEGGLSVVYPSSLPTGWRATSVDYQPGEDPAWGIGFLTDSDSFVGVRQEDAPLDDLLEAYVDEQPAEPGEVEVPGAIEPTWRVFEDEGGDTAYAAKHGADWLLVYGSAPRDDVETMVESLTDERP